MLLAKKIGSNYHVYLFSEKHNLLNLMNLIHSDVRRKILFAEMFFLQTYQVVYSSFFFFFFFIFVKIKVTSTHHNKIKNINTWT